MSLIGIIYVKYDIDSGYVYARFFTGDVVVIDYNEIEKRFVDNVYERSGLDYLIYNDQVRFHVFNAPFLILSISFLIRSSLIP